MIGDAALYMLNRLVMQPFKWDRFEDSYNLLAAESPSVPEAEGVYVVLAERTIFTYPTGGSSLFYVGMSSNLRRRLTDHRKFTLLKADEDDGRRFYPRYEWAARHGAVVSHVTRPRKNSTNAAKDIEHELIRVFADAFRAPPLGNSQSAW